MCPTYLRIYSAQSGETPVLTCQQFFFKSIVKATLLNVTNVFLQYHLTDSNQFVEINAGGGQFLGYCILQSHTSPPLSEQTDVWQNNGSAKFPRILSTS